MENVRIEFQDIRSGTIAGWVEYEDGEFFASGEDFSAIVSFYQQNGADNEYIVDVLSNWSNGVYQAVVVS